MFNTFNFGRIEHVFRVTKDPNTVTLGHSDNVVINAEGPALHVKGDLTVDGTINGLSLDDILPPGEEGDTIVFRNGSWTTSGVHTDDVRVNNVQTFSTGLEIPISDPVITQADLNQLLYTSTDAALQRKQDNLPTGVDGHILMWSDTESKWTAAPATALNGADALHARIQALELVISELTGISHGTGSSIPD